MDIQDLLETEPANPKASIVGPSGTTSFAAAAKSTIGKIATDEEAAAIEAEAADDGGDVEAVITAADDGDVEPDADGEEKIEEIDPEIAECKDPNKIPSWVKIPPGFKIPPGVQVFFVRIRKGVTRVPGKGDRVVVMWDLTPTDEIFAYKRSSGDTQRAVGELTKQMIRAFDGQKVDWTRGAASNIETFWRDIGGRGRALLMNIYHRAHNLGADELVDFFLKCVAVRSAVRSP